MWHEQHAFIIIIIIYFVIVVVVIGTGSVTVLKVPTKVAIGKVRQVACGNTHTLILSEDCNTVYSCGSGDGGKLGHGDTLKQLAPKVSQYYTNGYMYMYIYMWNLRYTFVVRYKRCVHVHVLLYINIQCVCICMVLV